MSIQGFFKRDKKTVPIIDRSGSTAMSSETLTTKNTDNMKINEIQNQNMSEFAKNKALRLGGGVAKNVAKGVVKGAVKAHEAKVKHDENKEIQKQATVADKKQKEDMVDNIIFNPNTSANEKFEKLQRLAIDLRDDERLDERTAEVINRNLKRLSEEKPHEIQPKSTEGASTIIHQRRTEPKPSPSKPQSSPPRPQPRQESTPVQQRIFQQSTGEESSNDEINLPENTLAEVGAVIEREDKKK